MTRRCVVPGCKTGRRTCEVKWSIFRAPHNFCDLQKWAKAIPGIDTLEPKHFVCEKHFDSKYIHREWVKRDSNNRIIAQSPYQRVQLDKLAIPTEFDDIADIEGPTHSSITIVSETVKNENEDQGNVPVESILSSVKSLDPVQQATGLQFESSSNLQLPHDTMTPLTQNVYVDIKKSPDDIKVPSNVKLPVSVDIGDSASRKMNSNHPVMKVACSQTTVRHTEATSLCVQPLKVYSTVVLVDTGSGNYEKCSLAVPKPWSLLHMPIDDGQRVTFALVIRKRQDDITVSPIIQKSVTLNADRTMNYHVYGCLSNTQDTGLENILLTNESFPNVLKRFQEMTICHGLGAVDTNHLPRDSVIIDNVEQWRSKRCTLLLKKGRCYSCAKMRKRALQNMSRLQSRRTFNRISKLSNSIDQYKLAAMRKKLSREQRQKNRAKKQVQYLTNCLKKLKVEIASMKLATLHRKCAELNVSGSQKAALKEIIAAASTDVKGRRYTQEWIMLCMLMNIRSPGYYEFLRKNNVLPLPCTRTIRTYFSLIDSKCVFDVKFAEILKKQFATKSPLQRNGVLLVDEINLRKSVAVCSKNDLRWLNRLRR
ncbi:uncharacterized protein LOC107267238 [Cephus cinctus]|uniref:Uncharacterized protein LOC107267238 n=1 Tax=Cephus cinctus TaxID=211228 RepID=A0AAJ7RGZ2_CEPCN|nr:uncharacterized protein LOC107267238 [Cephus cinctus]XP_024940216.1 uncharacterized protein LOC107267238 [Cephus cinctus]XP_024940217.1 uncharacterized protein LOC107267238 [Cephus cinctus]XP_024940218.1 uncharacterized protein LOC107267238 [Cephus cinctus]XP_024940219.1 uncharacterized protein LOC107267238 [Cephus cinctus]XP_024940220.1 uncharacterized protein LOC107267238 [Cephus cinctus]XP_024940221.1 uncharacterized protein LOC107267238 [Cephus cinctus]XP_024940222.1 uncharacterized p